MEENSLINDSINFKKILPRYLAMWPWIIGFLIISLFSAFIYLRYTTYEFQTKAIIEVIDKAQDSEMALPTSMTIFNRSMINLDNEIGRLSSFNLNSSVVSKLKSNIRYSTIGRIKSTQNHPSEFFDDYKIGFKINTDTITEYTFYTIDIEKNSMIIKKFDKDNNLIKKTSFSNFSTYDKAHNFPFDFSVGPNVFLENDSDVLSKKIEFKPFESTVDEFSKLVSYKQSKPIPTSGYNSGSDQIILSMNYQNKQIAEDYINTLIYEFDSDGISDRQLEYKNTIEFVDTRSVFLQKELEKIEDSKKEFKKKNNLNDLQSDANFTISQQYNYDSELFDSKSQLDLLNLLKIELQDNNSKLLPVNIGLNNETLNNLIYEHNKLVNDRERYIASGAGPSNSIIISIDNQLEKIYYNIGLSVENYFRSLNLKIGNLEQKELEFEDVYKNIPQNEKILRSINRELEIKEALYLLLLQKREEAAINFAVVKPTIKTIDEARSTQNPISPNRLYVIIFSSIIGILFPVLLLTIWFYFDNKVHTKFDIVSNSDIPLVGEIPYLKNSDFISNIHQINSSSRSVVIESVRMLISNLRYVFHNKTPDCKTILISSGIKGEGKTLVSVNISKLLSSSNKVILIGADLRNPQIHKYLDIDKSVKGLSEYIYGKSTTNYEDFILKSENLDIMLSGTIPPNPISLLQSDNFFNFINELKKKYDYIVIDSAPCLLVSDTFIISDLVDLSLLVVRANHTSMDVLDYLNEINQKQKLNNINLVLNGIGNSNAYGYRYNYQYGYNYGYGYGYFEDKDD